MTVKRCLGLVFVSFTLASVVLLTGGCPDGRAPTSIRPSTPSPVPPPPANQPAAEEKIVKVLYVEGDPRWEYRYIQLALLHHPAVRISCLLTSADPGYEQQASDPDPKIGFAGRVTAFPDTAEGLTAYDVILFGDVSSQQFTDKQFQLLCDFVRKSGGGFGMIAGPRFAPVSYRSTRISGLLPVAIDHVAADGKDEQFTEGFRPNLTEAGRVSRTFGPPDGQAALADSRPVLWEGGEPLFWYCRGASIQVAAGQKPPEVLAVHPSAKAPDGSDAPLLVLGRSGEGSVLFSAIDDSWRWRSAGRTSAYADYWVALLRALAPKQERRHAPGMGTERDSLLAQ
jgi:hypothetical protein